MRLFKRRKKNNTLPEWIAPHLKPSWVTSEDIEHFKSLTYEKRLLILHNLYVLGSFVHVTSYVPLFLAGLAVWLAMIGPFDEANLPPGMQRILLWMPALMLFTGLFIMAGTARGMDYNRKLHIYERYLDYDANAQIRVGSAHPWPRLKIFKLMSSLASSFLRRHRP